MNKGALFGSTGLSSLLMGMGVVLITGGAAQPYSRPDDFSFAAIGMRWGNVAAAIDSTCTRAGGTVTFKSPPWEVPAAADSYLLAFPAMTVVEGDANVNEAPLPNDVTIETVTISYRDAGNTTRRTTATFLSNGGVLRATGSEGGVIALFTPAYPIPANSDIQVRYALAFAAGAILPGNYLRITANGDSQLKSTGNSFVSAVQNGASLSSVSGSSTGLISGRIFGPCFAAAKGADGRPVWLIDGDSIAYGAGTIDSASPYHVAGIVEVGAARATNGYVVPVCNMSIKGSGISGSQTNPNIRSLMRALVDQVCALQSGRAPWSHYVVQQGTNSLVSDFPTFEQMEKDRAAWQQAWHDLPIIATTLTPKAKSTDGFRTLANQTPGTGNDATNGNRFIYNDELLANRLDGTFDFVVNTFAALSYDETLANRDKIKIAPFTATLTRTTTGDDATIYLSAAPAIGAGLVLDPLSGSGKNKIVTAVVEVTPGVEYQCTMSPGASSGAYVAKAIGTLVGETYSSDGDPAGVNTGSLHYTSRANDLVAPQYDAVKAALKAAVNGAWV